MTAPPPPRTGASRPPRAARSTPRRHRSGLALVPPPTSADEAELLRDLEVLVAHGLVVPVRDGAALRYAPATADP